MLFVVQLVARALVLLFGLGTSHASSHFVPLVLDHLPLLLPAEVV